MTDETVLYEVDADIGLLTINRPQKLNALDYSTIDRLMSRLDQIEPDRSVRAVILTGAGDKAFSAGADIAGFSESMKDGVDTAVREFVRRGQRLTSRIENFPKPIIVAVNGYAYGGGCEITEAAPLAIASEDASFGKVEINLGIIPTFGGTQRLARLIGRKRALRMILTGEPISAQEALSIGLINGVFPRHRLIEEARALARTISGRSPAAVAACLASVTRGLNMAIEEGLAMEASQFARVAVTNDAREGIDAFIEKRPARFTGS
jgi:enoyl-CoA hydratase/carnithine racemase